MARRREDQNSQCRNAYNNPQRDNRLQQNVNQDKIVPSSVPSGLRRSPRHINSRGLNSGLSSGGLNSGLSSGGLNSQLHLGGFNPGDLNSRGLNPRGLESDTFANLSQPTQEHEAEDISHTMSTQGGYNTTNRRRIQATQPRNEKGRGANKTKISKQRVFVEVNEYGQPISDSERQLSSLLGCLARDPRRLQLDCWDWRFLSQKKKDDVWEEAKQSFEFTEGREPYDWAMKTMNAAWRLQKCELKIKHFDGRTHEEAIDQRLQVPHIPEDMWKKLVEFWESPKGQERSKRNIENKRKSMMCHYAGSKSFARKRAEIKAKDGKEPDPLDVWLDTHVPKRGSRLDDASAAAKKAIEEDLARLPQGSCSGDDRISIFKKHVGEDKNGYAKTFGLGVKVPRSRTKRCALEEERAKRIKVETEAQNMVKKFDKMSNLVIKLLELQGMSKEEILTLLSDSEDVDNSDGENNDANENENFEEANDDVGEEDDYRAQDDYQAQDEEGEEYYDYE
ncbi:uncharacterized protein [Spinacia oleracea]|uniref:Uncharacterized protein n=1 Tax=Spinacia oleracea TaxID=3562 RepID=A0A9R0HXT5_SPIOL|nr:uncharacterized protein LOC110778730 [Spinacia oleracea]XP_056690096.1 uncharacterized protein LOC130465163 [Spinacia oleracea]